MAPGGDRAIDENDDRGLAHATLIGRYIVLEKLGEGAMGVVHAAYDPSLDRKVALKLLHASRDGDQDAARRAQRLQTEAKAIARLSHPNVVAIHDVGSHQGRVFLAMELLRGGTLRAWLEGGPRPRGEILELFVQIGRGLAAAHAAGVVHRDFKPDNVLLDGDGVPKVADFGVAHLLDGGAEIGPPQVPETPQTAPLPALTATGAVLGTPAYMAPEQFMGRTPDAHADQFAFCVALYEALYGERPFAGETFLELAAAAVMGERRSPPLGPAWLQRAVVRGLAPAKSDRHPSMQALVDTLERHLRPHLRRRATAAVAIGAGVALAVASLGYVGAKRQTFNRTVTARLDDGRVALREAERGAREAEALRSRMSAEFGEGRAADGESSWRAVLATTATARAQFARALQAGESALLMDPRRAEARELMADALCGRLLADAQAGAEADPDLTARLALYDPQGQRRARLSADAVVSIEASVPGARADVERFERRRDDGGRYQPVSRGLALPLANRALPPGSYRITVSAPHAPTLGVPILLRAGARERVRVDLPADGDLPADFVLVPGGDFLSGSATGEEFRRDLFRTAPLHQVRGHGFFIKRHETTYGEWIDYLDALPPSERARRIPRAASVGMQGELALRRLGEGRWSLRLQPSTHALVARTGEPLRDPGRSGFEAQDWTKLPVSAVSADDADSYAAWLRTSGRVPGARLCSNEEWEQAARGADGRTYPHGWRIAPGDANYAGTWHSDIRRYGPVMVGSFPRSDSPYGVSDMAGNVWEWVRLAGPTPGQSLRGGAFPFDLVAQRSDVREQAEAPLRDITVGVRICADYHGRSDSTTNTNP